MLYCISSVVTFWVQFPTKSTSPFIDFWSIWFDVQIIFYFFSTKHFQISDTLYEIPHDILSGFYFVWFENIKYFNHKYI